MIACNINQSGKRRKCYVGQYNFPARFGFLTHISTHYIPKSSLRRYTVGMFPSILILGRQPALGLAELESLYGAEAVQPLGSSAALLNKPADEVEFTRLGGSLKLAKVLTELPSHDWESCIKYIEKSLPGHLGYLPEGKLKLGLSAFGMNVKADQISRSALRLKKVVKNSGRSVRVVPNNEPALNSAQVLHNQLTSKLGMELLLIRNGNKAILAQTSKEQDIDAYAARDQQRPMRDTKVGMLPPKLAQVIVNLANPAPDGILLDPFCGTGVILQEAALMGSRVIGTDLDERMVRYTRDNINWLQDTLHSSFDWHLEVGDATTHQWSEFNAIACETYLGRPFSAPPKSDILSEVMQDVDTIHKKFLQNVASQTQPGFTMCIAVPAWKTAVGFKHLKTLESLAELGYTRKKFVHVDTKDLVYHREGQVVARELVVVTRK